MKNEALRRMRLFNLPDECISAFEKDGKIPCFDWNGNLIEITDDIQRDIDEVSSRGDCVYLVVISKYFANHKFVMMYNYFYASCFEADWADECSKYADGLYYVNAAVKSELTGGYFDYGTVYLKTKGGIRRLAFPEAVAFANSQSVK